MIRQKRTKRSLKMKNTAQDNVAHCVETTASNFRLISGYMMRHAVIDEFEEVIGDFNAKDGDADLIKTNNTYLATWLSIIMVGLWFVIGGMRVINPDDPETIGMFVTTLGIFKDVGNSWSVIHGLALTVQSAFVPLARITMLMNLQTELKDRHRQNRKKREIGAALHQEVCNEINGAQATDLYTADMVSIKLIDVSYVYSQSLLSLDSLQRCNAEFSQGSLVALVGPPNKGKSTMMKLIGGVLIPHTGAVVIPLHLRVLHIALRPVFFEGTLFQNLIYGLKAKEADAAKTRVLTICRLLKVPDYLHYLLNADESDENTYNWNDTLSFSTRAQLNLARALINNPHVLVLHKPTLYLDDDLATNTFQVLRQFVDLKGLEQNAEYFTYRRPRTCIVSTTTSIGISLADSVFEVRGDRCEESENLVKSRGDSL
eukprot:gnl/MRDRNA2_/MRDRNA2_199922_c0_seq1.p1 gnl/MRDRNA2_/MRDRNA2_199922_c0~~gnl/MRDRNA2_/MRDRNA2_199922_c0_seq1.p1  ORF type:complete len:429 (-),score=56.10 gnl/MRDRNA2_/MRDRNA2_199922_c0_seq1:8-1294(-)